MSSEKRSCENCGNARCANGIVAPFYDECVKSNYTQHWKPKKGLHICLLGIDPAKSQKCTPSECPACGWEASEAERRTEYRQKHGLTLCGDGLRRLIIEKTKESANDE